MKWISLSSSSTGKPSHLPQPAWTVPEVALSRPWLEPSLRLPYPVPGLNRPWGCLMPLSRPWLEPSLRLPYPVPSLNRPWCCLIPSLARTVLGCLIPSLAWPVLLLPYPVPGLDRPWGCLIPSLAWSVPDVALSRSLSALDPPHPPSSTSGPLNFPRKWGIKYGTLSTSWD